MQVLVVWEPILPSDWRPPSGSTLRRVSDRRARQFWDPDHLVSAELDRHQASKPGQSQPQCCTRKGFEWDQAILYAPGSRWHDATMPVFWNGPVAKKMVGLEKAVRDLKGTSSGMRTQVSGTLVPSGASRRN